MTQDPLERMPSHSWTLLVGHWGAGLHRVKGASAEWRPRPEAAADKRVPRGARLVSEFCFTVGLCSALTTAPLVGVGGCLSLRVGSSLSTFLWDSGLSGGSGALSVRHGCVGPPSPTGRWASCKRCEGPEEGGLGSKREGKFCHTVALREGLHLGMFSRKEQDQCSWRQRNGGRSWRREGFRWTPQRVWEARVCYGSLCTPELGGQSGGPGPQHWTETQHRALLSDLPEKSALGLGTWVTLVNLPNQQSHAAWSPWDNQGSSPTS